MRWLALSGLIALLPTAAFAVDECPRPPKTCTADDANRWGGCRGEALRNLLKERDCLENQASLLRDAAAIADVSQVEPRFIGRILLERKLISVEGSDWILRNNMLTQEAIDAIQKFQREYQYPPDGWLRSDEFVRLTCETAKLEGKQGPPYSKYYLGWMYLAGQGVEPSRPLALELLKKARAEFKELNGTHLYDFYLSQIETWLDTFLRAGRRGGARPSGDSGPARDYCPDFSKFIRVPPYGEIRAKLEIPLPETAIGYSDERAGPDAQPRADHE